MSSSTAQKQLRHYISFLTFIASIVIVFIYIYASTQYKLELFWQDIVQIAAPIILFFTYIYSIRSNHTHVNKFLRALIILAIIGTWLYTVIQVFVYRADYNIAYSCSDSGGPICYASRAEEILTILCSCLILFEVGVTLKYGSLPDNTYPIDMSFPTVAPQQQYQQQQLQQLQPQQPYSPHYVTPNASNVYYSQMQQQPYPLMTQQPINYNTAPKFETQESLYQNLQGQQQQQSQYYQQQVQQHPYSVQGYSAPQPRIPGSMVTAAPQPGGSPIMPYPSPGHSVAVSPVLPPGGYSPISSTH